MKLISNFKDYYDFLIGKYGIDDNIVFNRTIFKGNVDFYVECDSLPNIVHVYPNDNKNYYSKLIDFYCLVICGKMYLLIQYPDESLKLISEFDFENENIYHEVAIDIIGYKNFRKKKKITEKDLQKEVIGKYNKNLIGIHKEIKSPIFIITRAVGRTTSPITISERSPILRDIKGIPSLIPAEDLYKDIIYFIGNVINNNPDEGKINNISNRDKIIKGGFDPITSFRNM